MDGKDFRSLSQEQLEQVFIALDFKTQCRLRRTCKRWLSVLHSRDVLHAVFFSIPIWKWETGRWRIRKNILRHCIGRAAPHLKICLFIGHSTDQGFLQDKNTIDPWHWIGKNSQAYLCNILDCINTGHGDLTVNRIVFVGLSFTLTPFLWDKKVPKSVEQVTLARAQIILNPCNFMYHPIDPLPVDPLERYLLDMSSRDEQTVIVTDPYTFRSSVPIHAGGPRYILGALSNAVPGAAEVFLKMFRDNVPARLTVKQRRLVYEFIAWTYEDVENRQKIVFDCLKRTIRMYQPELKISPDTDLAGCKYAKLSPFVRRQLQTDLIDMALAWNDLSGHKLINLYWFILLHYWAY